MKLPELLSGARIVRRYEAPLPPSGAGAAGNDLAFHDDRS
jgi:hypothetical protein